MIECRRLRPDEWRELRTLRLRALRDSPQAFGRTAEEEEAFDDGPWQRSAKGIIYVATDGTELMGLAGLAPDETTTEAVLWGMWVEPARRRAGIGRELLKAAIAGARQHGVRRIHLGVTEGNEAARSLYEDRGFVPTGEMKPLRPGSDQIEVEMELVLTAGGMDRITGESREPLRAAVEIARHHGVRSENPIVLRDHTNLLVHLSPAPVVARISTITALTRDEPARLDQEVRAVAHLASRGAPVVPPAAELPPGPHNHAGFNVTFWAHVKEMQDAPRDWPTAGRALRVTREELLTYQGDLPRFGPLEEVPQILELLADADALSSDDLALLGGVQSELALRLARLGVSPVPLHGDAHLGNVLWSEAGPLWGDFEDICRGPSEWDVACLVAPERVWGADEEGAVDAALTGLGVERPGGEVVELLVHVRLLFTAAWANLIATRRPAARESANRRLAWWRDAVERGTLPQ